MLWRTLSTSCTAARSLLLRPYSRDQIYLNTYILVSFRVPAASSEFKSLSILPRPPLVLEESDARVIDIFLVDSFPSTCEGFQDSLHSKVLHRIAEYIFLLPDDADDVEKPEHSSRRFSKNQGWHSCPRHSERVGRSVSPTTFQKTKMKMKRFIQQMRGERCIEGKGVTGNQGVA